MSVREGAGVLKSVLGFGSRPSSPSDVPSEVAWDVLSNKRRRLATRVMAGLPRGEWVTRGEVATGVATLEYEKDAIELEPQERKRVLSSLTQSHQQKLERAGIVETGESVARWYRGENAEWFASVIRDVEGEIE